ncbi:MAG: D-aminoacyl-tRNA deacylase [Erysipelotrichaceae bacterium]
MKVVLQRVKSGNVIINNEVYNSINNGYVLLVGIIKGDSDSDLQKVADKIANLRIIEDDNGKMNISIIDKQYEILSISQFTLAANIKKGRRPSFELSEEIDLAKEKYALFNEYLRKYGLIVKEGIFQSEMVVNIENDGPVTIVIESEEL